MADPGLRIVTGTPASSYTHFPISSSPPILPVNNNAFTNQVCPLLPRSHKAAELTCFNSWFRSLQPKMQGAIGLGLLGWGSAGLFLSDTAEKKLGFEASEQDKEALKAFAPKITVVERD